MDEDILALVSVNDKAFLEDFPPENDYLMTFDKRPLTPGDREVYSPLTPRDRELHVLSNLKALHLT